MDEPYNMMNSKLDVKSIHSQHDMIEATSLVVSHAGISREHCIGSIGGHHGDQWLVT